VYRLSRSKTVDGLQCPRRLRLTVHNPELVQHPPSIERTVAMGHEVGRVAQELAPGVSWPVSLATSRTPGAGAKRLPDALARAAASARPQS
jgi:hypothetical protein